MADFIRIKMPRYIKSDSNGIELLLKIVKYIKYNENEKIILDFSNTMFFASELYGFYHYYIDFMPNVVAEKVFDNIDKVMHLSKKYMNSDVPKHSSSIMSKNFSEDLSKGNLNCFDEYMKKEFLPKIIDNSYAINVLISYLSELFINSRTHGNTNEIICGGQKYPNKDKLVFSIIDFGVTIPFNVENHLINGKKYYFKSNDGGAIDWAVKEKNSTKEKLGGLGLNTISDFIENIGGKLTIFSRKGIYIIENGKSSMGTLKNRFDGTIVILEFSINKFNVSRPSRKLKTFEL